MPSTRTNVSRETSRAPRRAMPRAPHRAPRRAVRCAPGRAAPAPPLAPRLTARRCERRVRRVWPRVSDGAPRGTEIRVEDRPSPTDSRITPHTIPPPLGAVYILCPVLRARSTCGPGHFEQGAGRIDGTETGGFRMGKMGAKEHILLRSGAKWDRIPNIERAVGRRRKGRHGGRGQQGCGSSMARTAIRWTAKAACLFPQRFARCFRRIWW